jgi:hypothetical protein
MDDELKILIEKDRIIDCVNRLFIGTDERDWPAVRACFTDEVLFDMTSLLGGQAATVSPQMITDNWARGFEKLQSVHHQAGNYRVEVAGERAQVFCYAVAFHYRAVPSGNNSRMFAGSYDLWLVRENGDWLINAFRFNLKFIDGNRGLESEE